MLDLKVDKSGRCIKCGFKHKHIYSDKVEGLYICTCFMIDKIFYKDKDRLLLAKTPDERQWFNYIGFWKGEKATKAEILHYLDKYKQMREID